MCTSGSSRDCNNEMHSIYCNKNVKVDSTNCSMVKQNPVSGNGGGNEGEGGDVAGEDNTAGNAVCPKGLVITGRAASGGQKHADLYGDNYFTYINCCKILNERKTSIKKSSILLGKEIIVPIAVLSEDEKNDPCYNWDIKTDK